MDEPGITVRDLTHPITLTLSYDEDSLPSGKAEADLVLYRYDTGLADWVALVAWRIRWQPPSRWSWITSPNSH